MNALQAIVLGVVQGLTEFLPISSSAHLRIVPAVFGWEDPGSAFTAVCQLGTMAAVLLYFRKDLWRVFLGWWAGLWNKEVRHTLDSRMGWYLIIGTIPISICGLAFKSQIEGPLRSLGVIGVGLGGSEPAHPPELFIDVFHAARELGFRTSAHAGEAAGAASVWTAVHSLQVDRIGHGTRAAEDEELLDYLVEHRIPLEMCPISNLRTGVVRTIEEHPIRKFFDRGILITVNTDDPKMFGCSLAEELTLLAQGLAFSGSELQTVLLNGITASFLSEPEKDSLRRSFLADPAWPY